MIVKADFKILKEKILFTKWHRGEMTLDEVKVIMEEILVALKKNNIKYYVDDISECNVDWEKADKWIVSDWYPRALKLNVRKNALIVSPGIVMAHKDDQCEIRSFYETKSALEWITPSLRNRLIDFLNFFNDFKSHQLPHPLERKA